VTPLLSTAILRTQSDRRLVALARAGHEVAFEAIVERYRGQLRRYCVRLLPEGRADDALQHAFLLAWTALQQGREVRELRPWLYAVAHNAAITQLRSGVFDYVELLDTVEGAGGTEADVERRSVMRQTLAAVAALPSRQRDALLAVALEGRPQAEVAHEMGLTDNGLRQLLFRARSTVRAAATAVTPLPMLVWAVRAAAGAGAGAVAGGASALPTGTALVVAGTLAVGGAAGLRTPAVPHHTPVTPAVAATPTAGPVAARHARTAPQRTGVRGVDRSRLGVRAQARIAHRAARVVALRGAHGVRVTAHSAPRVAPHPAGAAPQFVSTTPAAPAGPQAAPAPAVAQAAQASAPAAPATADTPAPAGTAEQPAAPSADDATLPRAHRDDDENDDGHDDADAADAPSGDAERND
jgi:RNA polymerase sigma factor (sigma-70 family)